jgi:hypothetical protein
MRKEIEEELRHRSYGGDDDRRSDDSQHRQQQPRRLPAPDPEVVEEKLSFARRRLSRQYHPDVGPSGDLERMKAVNAACDWIIAQVAQARGANAA